MSRSQKPRCSLNSAAFDTSTPRVPPIVPLFTHSPVRLRHGRRLGLLVILAHEGSAKSSAEFAIERLTGPGTSDGAPTWLALEP